MLELAPDINQICTGVPVYGWVCIASRCSSPTFCGTIRRDAAKVGVFALFTKSWLEAGCP